MVLGKRLASAFRGMKVEKLQTSWIKMHFLYYCSVRQCYTGKLVIDFFFWSGFLAWVGHRLYFQSRTFGFSATKSSESVSSLLVGRRALNI